MRLIRRGAGFTLIGLGLGLSATFWIAEVVVDIAGVVLAVLRFIDGDIATGFAYLLLAPAVGAIVDTVGTFAGMLLAGLGDVIVGEAYPAPTPWEWN